MAKKERDLMKEAADSMCSWGIKKENAQYNCEPKPAVLTGNDIKQDIDTLPCDVGEIEFVMHSEHKRQLAQLRAEKERLKAFVEVILDVLNKIKTNKKVDPISLGNISYLLEQAKGLSK